MDAGARMELRKSRVRQQMVSVVSKTPILDQREEIPVRGDGIADCSSVIGLNRVGERSHGSADDVRRLPAGSQ